VPINAVSRVADRVFVQVVKRDKVELRKITVGITSLRSSEARDGLEAGETVVARAAAFLRSGDTVRPIELTAQAGDSAKATVQ